MFSKCVDSQSQVPLDELKEKILIRKQELGDSLVILTHHYQRPEIVEIGDFVGDSFKLAKEAAALSNVKHVIFCGVNFMAEAADILTADEVSVQLAAPTAICPMAEMASVEYAEAAAKRIEKITGKKPIPVVYMNSYADIKAFAGRLGGIVCTSSNAPKAVEWALAQDRPVLFLPDRNLGLNTAAKLGIPRSKIALWDRKSPDGNVSDEELARAEMIVWGGFCHVHVMFKPSHIEAVRRRDPNAKVVVHPECDPDVVDAADANGSTEFIVRYIKDQPSGSTIYVGTEVHLVERLNSEYDDKRILPLWNGGICFNMAKTTLMHISCAIDEKFLGKSGLIRVDSSLAQDAKIALDNMLSLK